MLLHTKAGDWKLLRANNTTDDAYAARPSLLGRYPSLLFTADRNHVTTPGNSASQATARSFLWPNDSEGGDTMPNAIQWMPFVVGADNVTAKVRWLAWNPARKKDISNETWEWNWFKHSEWTCTGCAATGVAGSFIGSSSRYCDTIAIVTNAGNTNQYSALSPQDDTPGMVTMDFIGATMLEPQLSINGSSASCNLLYRWLY